MKTCFSIFFILTGLLFILKMAYVVCTAWVLPKTRGALYVSTANVRIRAFLDAVHMKPGEILIDLGCGDGRVLRAARSRYHVTTIGYELNPLACLNALIRSFAIRGVDIRRRNFFDADLTNADVVFCYLFPDVMEDLSKKLLKELKPGSIFVSCNFPLPGFEPKKVLRPGGSLHNDPIYIYEFR